jgi:secreted PhoX family phosphatase
VQRIRLSDGQVETVLRGMSRCDGIRATPWGTILATEETTDGGAYEILDPLHVTEQSVLDRATGNVSDAAHIAKRAALPTMAWEGLVVLPSGVVIGGDELRPGSPADADGGAIFKFVPATPRVATGEIGSLVDSPLAAGSVYAMQVSCRDSTQQYGQGCEIGNAAWVAVNAATARGDANTNGATGYYRPEDLEMDPVFKDEANADAVRFCWNNTGNEDGKNYAEVVCGVDSAPLTASNTQRTVVVNRFVEGDTDFNSFDNLAFQPGSGNLYVIEDHDNGDVFACLKDGSDRDIKTDGCIKVLSVKDSSAEPTGFIFSPDGRTAYVSIQHSDDTNMPLVDGYPTDDVIRITGFDTVR